LLAGPRLHIFSRDKRQATVVTLCSKGAILSNSGIC